MRTPQSPGEPWPPPGFRFRVQLPGGVTAMFLEMSGMDAAPSLAERRHAPVAHPAGDAGAGTVTLHRGVFANDEAFWRWYDGIRMNTAPRGGVVITLLDDGGRALTTWTLRDARPLAVTGTDLESGGAEVAVEKLDLAYEALVTVPS